ncbi:PAS domain S-box protein [Aquirufa nivalisilvae]|uniref:PAS domain S-box protein n=1 Tax=Aquirufa nivalisilvae TaxID=2516557 RepID=UPI0022A9C280|nr:PAS domain S-box protein [Aquirufa nivalisilvae]MCZ2483678.1 PAS domain S-box protein [Aquirufa nivalisilvae]
MNKINPIPANEEKRLQALYEYHILDSVSEQEYDKITALASQICQVPIAIISLVDKNRQWFKSEVGLGAKETPRDISFCQYTIMGEEVFEVPNALEDERFVENPLVTGDPHIRFYAGAPLITPDGYNIGSLCVIDRMPKELTKEQRDALNTLAEHVIMTLELRIKNNVLTEQVNRLTEEKIARVTMELGRYKEALDEVLAVFIMDSQGIITYANEAICALSQYSREELLGHHKSILHPEFNSSLESDTFWETIQSGEVWKGEIQNIAKDGSIYWLNITFVPFKGKDGKVTQYLAISSDITEQKIKSIDLELFFELSQDYLTVANKNGFFEKVSPSFYRSLGYTEDEIMSNSGAALVIDEDLPLRDKLREKMFRGEGVKDFELRYKCKDGTVKVLSWNSSPNEQTGKLYGIARDITASKKIIEENNRLSWVAKGTDNIVVIADPQGLIEWVNDPFEKLTGYTLDEVIGKKPGSFLQYEGTDQGTSQAMQEAIANRQVFKGEIRNRSKSGREYWLELSINPIFNNQHELINFIAIESDITEKKEKDLEISNLLATQIAIFNGAGLAIIFTDVNGVVQKVNQATLELFEYEEDEIVNMLLSQIPCFDMDELIQYNVELSEEYGTEFVPSFETFVMRTRSTGKPERREWTLISKSGKRIPIWLGVTCVKNETGEIIGYLGVAEDYTEHKQAQNELIRAKEIAESAANAKDSFLANMSHEIRTPLNAIIGFTELLQQRNLPSPDCEYIENIQTAGDHLLLLINDILDLSKIDSGKIEMEIQPFSLKESLKHVYSILKVKSQKKAIEFSLFLDADLPDAVIGDKGRLNQVLINLAGNAIKFTEEGEVIISVKKVQETDSRVSLRFSVKDTGIGISEEKIKTIFDRFTQAEASTTRKFGGSGLGLNIAKQLVELQGGKIELKSQLGRGSEFSFVLELEKTKQVLESQQNKKSSNLSLEQSVSILMCEDNEMNQRLAKTVITNFGFQLDIANNGKDGIELLKQKSYDLILMDLQMPEMDGYQATKYIRNEMKSDIPIIAMTAHSLVGEQQKCFDIGMNGYVSKPYKQQELLQKIQEFIRE